MAYPKLLSRLQHRFMTTSDFTLSCSIETGSKWFQGHFPDNPILPGIAQLKFVADLVTTSEKETLQMTGVSRVKFRRIVRPQDRLDIAVSREKKGQRYQFSITCGDEDVCSGRMYFKIKTA